MLMKDPSDRRCFQVGAHYTPELRRRIDTRDPVHAHWSGYPIAPGSTTTVDELEAYYIRGEKGRGGHAPADVEQSREDGQPISGDESARFRLWRQSGHWPTYQDVGLPLAPPEPRHLAPAEPRTPLGELPTDALF
ncbi:hypothetical protein EJ130_02250 [Micrococcus luteus]|uniref:hypothetical protein n=1 Tax=Micrococcus luteus TaxID=1270 RepID=UPI0022B32D05|nr:hypothetical protein [Micrococcus luteus]MCZ6937126.1 hypothetical protein [Micrococcus luteus]